LSGQHISFAASYHHTVGSVYRLVCDLTQIPLERFILKRTNVTPHQLLIHFDVPVVRVGLAGCTLYQELLTKDMIVGDVL